MKIKPHLLFLLFLFTCHSYAKTPWPAASQPGNLSITVVASESPQFLMDWVNPKMVNKVSIKRLREVKAEQVAYCGFIITGLTPTPKPYSTLQYKVGFKLYGPSGALLHHEPNYTRGKFKNPEKPIYTMADPALDLVLEHSDPAGIYTLEGIVTDLVTGITANNSYKLTLLK